jgi:glutathione synthase
VKSFFLTEKIGYPGKSDTNLLIKESCFRFETFAFEPQDIVIENGIVKANCVKVSLSENGELKPSLEKQKINLENNSIITIRLNPPFDARYLSAMYMLAQISGNSYVNNNAFGIINLPEKFIPKDLQKYTPKTIITEDEKEIYEFWKEHKDIVLKPLYDFGGNGVFRLKSEEENHKSIIKSLKFKYNEPLIAQKYLPEVKAGDKRIGLLDGDFFGAFLRKPPEGQIQAAVIQGGSFIKTEITKEENEIIEILKPILISNDIFLCGFDMIGNYLTEINVTCPAIFYCLNELYKNDADYVPSEKVFWDRLEDKLNDIKK